ncbi:c-type cytochrome [Falsirhodobacter sp. 20TX0035]|uniref:c-type cytochrome n=1 Tax=Falsirhodobacter sp. 20TX0035 TaxID=3022019 RepID=UPI00232FD71B|nr:cytochrome c family protein [Falsirhodobacter sp. 20TX0035]MDB6452424.1 cytochrome c family protein [Falsirhodobacter sp. 20TX0035]
MIRLIAAGAGALLVYGGLTGLASVLYAPPVVPLAYAIAPVEAPPPPPSAAEVLAQGDPAHGRDVFVRCQACHKLGTNGIGPHLDGVVGRAKASVPGFAYSGALRATADQAWTPEDLDAFLTNPRGYAPGTKMAFAGLPNAQDRADVIAYLQTQP